MKKQGLQERWLYIQPGSANSLNTTETTKLYYFFPTDGECLFFSLFSYFSAGLGNLKILVELPDINKCQV